MLTFTKKLILKLRLNFRLCNKGAEDVQVTIHLFFVGGIFYFVVFFLNLF
jgi:hypothetical protein